MTFFNDRRNARKRKSIFFAFFLCVLVIFYYSWLPYPKLASETYLPAWLLDWSNLHFNLRTAFPFIGVGFLLEMLGATSGQKKNAKVKVLMSLYPIVLAAIIVSIAEVGQYFIVNRHPDSMDILFGILGSVLGAFVYHIGVLLRKTKMV